jgi:hypothetical protein
MELSSVLPRRGRAVNGISVGIPIWRNCMPRARIFALVRVPKSGSTTLVSMVRSALPGASIYYMPKLMRSDEGPSRLEKLREMRGRSRRFWKLFRVLSEDMAWRRLAVQARDGDIVSGHFSYGALALPGFRAEYITLLRDPFDRLLSEYNYARVGFQKRWRHQHLYHRGKLAAAARLSFGDYLIFLEDNRELFENIATRYVTGGRVCKDPVGFLDENYYHWGVLERLEQFAAGLSAKLGVEVRPHHERITPRQADIALTGEDRARFERLFSEDIRMYQRLQDRLDEGTA